MPPFEAKKEIIAPAVIPWAVLVLFGQILTIKWPDSLETAFVSKFFYRGGEGIKYQTKKNFKKVQEGSDVTYNFKRSVFI